jgi:hypothetical protein
VNRFTYYSPFFIGAGLMFIMHETIAAGIPAERLGWKWAYVTAFGLGAGLILQLMMVGTQGAFAQVLPAPRGRSIRGRGAVVCGGLIIAAMALCVIAWLLQTEGVVIGVWIAGGLAAASAAGAVVTYIWCWPTALSDFGEHGQAAGR